MAKYICPSCGAEFNGKKCKRCNYEALKGSPIYRPSPKPSAQAPGSFPNPPASRRADPDSGSGRKKWKKRWGKVLTFVCTLFIAYTVFLPPEYSLLMLDRSLNDIQDSIFYDPPEKITEFPAFTVPAWEIPPLSGSDYQLLYEDDNFTVWADCEQMWQEGIIYVTAENRTNRPVDLYVNHVILNDQLCSFYSSLYIKMSSGSTSQGLFFLESLSQKDVYPAKVSFRLFACDSETYDIMLQTDTMSLTAPEGEIVPIPRPEGTLVAQAEGMEVSYISWENPENLDSGRLRFGLVNDTDRELHFFCDSAQANGENATISLYCILPPHTIAYSDAHCWALKEDLNIMSADQLDSLELCIGVFDEEAPNGRIVFDPFSVPLP